MDKARRGEKVVLLGRYSSINYAGEKVCDHGVCFCDTDGFVYLVGR